MIVYLCDRCRDQIKSQSEIYTVKVEVQGRTWATRALCKPCRDDFVALLDSFHVKEAVQ